MGPWITGTKNRMLQVTVSGAVPGVNHHELRHMKFFQSVRSVMNSLRILITVMVEIFFSLTLPHPDTMELLPHARPKNHCGSPLSLSTEGQGS